MNNLLIFLKKKELFIGSIIFLFSVFFWDIKLNNFIQSKFLIILLIPYFFINWNKSNFLKISVVNFCFVILLLLHSVFIAEEQIFKIYADYQNENFDGEITYPDSFNIRDYAVGFNFSNYLIFSTIFLLLLSFVCLNLTKNFEIILLKSSKIFIILFNILIILELLSYNYYLYDQVAQKNGLCAIFSEDNGYILKYFFLENSHFAMTSVGIIIYQLLNFGRLEFFHKFNYIIFIFLSILFVGSLTLYLGIIISIIFIIIFKLYKKILPLIFLLILNFSLIYNLDNCFLRITQIGDMKNIYLDAKSNTIQKILDSKIFKTKNEKYLENVLINATTIVHINHVNFAIETIKKNPFGVGFQNYGIYSLKYSKDAKLIRQHRDLQLINFNDGASNLTKLFTEFGLINIIFVILFIYSLFKSKFNHQTKALILSLVITQLIRGAGYFNGGFIIVILLLIYSNFIKLNYNSSSA